MNQQARIRALAKEHHLVRIDFLGADGKHGARGNAVTSVRLEFENEEVEIIEPENMLWLRDLQFYLRPQPIR